MGKTAIPSVFPAEGTYELSTLHVNLSCAASHAVIHYTIDGTEPTADSPIYHREAGLIPVKHTDGAESITIRAFAQADGLQPSDTVAFTYRFAAAPRAYSAIHCCVNRRIRLPVSSVLRISISIVCISSSVKNALH